MISTFRLFINDNSCSRNANAMYGVFVIRALNSWNLSLPRKYDHPVNTAKFFWLIGDCINGVPLYSLANIRCLALHNIPLLWLITFFNILIASIAKIYFESRSKNKLEKLLLFYNFFGMNSQKFHLSASDAIWTLYYCWCKNNLENLNWNVPSALLS